MILPLHKGRVISVATLTRKKLPPSSSTAPLDFLMSPTVSHKLLPLSLSGSQQGCHGLALRTKPFKLKLLHWGISCIPLHDDQMLIKPPMLAFQNLFTFERLSNTINTLLLPWFLILNPLVVLHRCLKVWATTSIQRKHVVKNSAVIKNSPLLWSSRRMKPVRSFSDNDRLFQLLINCSIVSQ